MNGDLTMNPGFGRSEVVMKFTQHIAMFLAFITHI